MKNNKLGEEILPERCRFRKINEQICIASIGQLKARNFKLSTEEYEQLVLHVKKNFSKTINDNMININFKNLDVEDRVLSCLRASSSGDKLKRIINIKREDATSTIYKRWNPKKIFEKLDDEPSAEPPLQPHEKIMLDVSELAALEIIRLGKDNSLKLDVFDLMNHLKRQQSRQKQ